MLADVSLADDTPISRQTQGNPGAGADWTWTVPAKSRFMLLGVEATNTTAVTAGNRVADLVITDGTNEIARVPATIITVASSTTVYTWQAGQQNTGSGSANVPVLLPLPDTGYMLGPGYQVKTVTANLKAGDQWSSIILCGQLYETA